jgi:hypothetical protein
VRVGTLRREAPVATPTAAGNQFFLKNKGGAVQFKIFTIPVSNDGAAIAEMSRFQKKLIVRITPFRDLGFVRYTFS